MTIPILKPIPEFKKFSVYTGARAPGYITGQYTFKKGKRKAIPRISTKRFTAKQAKRVGAKDKRMYGKAWKDLGFRKEYKRQLSPSLLQALGARIPQHYFK